MAAKKTTTTTKTGSKSGKRMSCHDAGKELTQKHTSRAGRRLSTCVGTSCSSAGWELSVLGKASAARKLRTCGHGHARRDNPSARPLRVIAREIAADWKPPYYAAVPYINAMGELGSIDDKLEQDGADEIVVRFLANAGRWRGPVAKRVKDELRDMVGIKRVANPHEDDEEHSCSMCNGPGNSMGSLGDREWFRCRNCGWEWSIMPEMTSRKTPTRKSPAPKKAASRRSNPGREGEHGFEYVELDGNMSPRTIARMQALVRERATGNYPIEAHQGSADERVLARRRVEPSGTGKHGRLKWVLSVDRLERLLTSMLQSGRDDEHSLATGILTTLDIGTV